VRRRPGNFRAFGFFAIAGIVSGIPIRLSHPYTDPVAPQGFGAGDREMQEENGPGAEALEIMVIDDSTTVLKVYERTFASTKELKGFRIVNFTSARIALDWLGQHPERKPALMLLDRIMEGLNGMEMLARLKGDERLKDIPVIMASSMGEQAAVVEAIRAGASDYIVKPLQSGVLAAKVLRVLATRSAREAVKVAPAAARA
jgi:PleD family two-component response regulator